jgi:hypothetical protein
MTDDLPQPSTPVPAQQADRSRSTRLLVVAAVLLLVAAIGLGLWAWLGGRDEDGPDYEADCALMEEKAPDLGPSQAGLLSEMRGSSPGSDKSEAAANVDEQAQVFRDMADGMTDREFAAEIEEYADSSERIAQGMRERDIGVLMGELSTLTSFVREAPRWLDEHCPRWLGPGQWGEPGSTPTGPTELPTDLLTEIPTDLPSLPSTDSTPPPD